MVETIIDAIEDEIKFYQTKIKYDTKEYPVETIVEKYTKGKEEDNSEIFVPLYQRAFVRDEKRKSKFIESVLLEIPIPLIFLADISDQKNENDDARLEIVDGSQRIRTLAAFLNNELKIVGLKKLTHLNGKFFSDLPLGRQRRFNRTPIRWIELKDCDIETRKDIFERINTSSSVLNSMEVRKGVQGGTFYDLIKECSEKPLFKELCPLSNKSKDREEDKEYILRFFAYSERYEEYNSLVSPFLDAFIIDNKDAPDGKIRESKFDEVMEFVKKHFPYGFKKTENSTTAKGSTRFEALAVGVRLALDIKPGLKPKDIDWFYSKQFSDILRTDGANNRSNFRGRISFVRDNLLKD